MLFKGVEMKRFLLILGATLLAIVLPFVFSIGQKNASIEVEQSLPWQIQVDGRGSSVFGLSPGRSTVNDLISRFGNDLEIGIILGRGEVGAVEGYYSQLSLGFVMARLIVTVDVPADLISAMKARAAKAEFMESGARRIHLSSEDRRLLGQYPIRALSVIPNVNLDEMTVIQRFGAPEERLQVSEKRVHLLYPAKGLDIIVDGQGKELFQYVAPRDFHLLRDPLRKGEPLR